MKLFTTIDFTLYATSCLGFGLMYFGVLDKTLQMGAFFLLPLSGWMVVKSFATGENYTAAPKPINRDRSPVLFWANTVFQVAIFIVLFIVVLGFIKS